MNLALDLGNTRIKYAVFSDQKMVVNGTLEEKDLNQLLKHYPIQYLVYSSTRKHIPRWLKVEFKNYRTLALDHLTKVPITNLYNTPETLGRDRIAGVVAAHSSFPSKNNLVIDAGTCITLDFITKDGKYHGGNITPGLWMRIKAMNRFTGKLPLVEKQKPLSILGKSTETALQNGAILGTILEIEGFIGVLKEKYGVVNIILTGGDADFLANNLKTNIFVTPNLILEGLNEILIYNAKTF